MESLRIFGTVKATLRALAFFLCEAWRADRSLVFVVTASRLLRASQPFLVLYVGKLIFDELQRWMSPTPPRSNWIYILVFFEFGLALAFGALERTIAFSEKLLAEKYGMQLAEKLIGHVSILDLQQIESADVQERLTRINRLLATRITFVTLLTGTLQDVVLTGLLMVGLLFYSWWLVPIIAISFIPATFREFLSGSEGYELSYKQTEDQRRFDYFRNLATDPQSAKEIKFLSLYDFICKSIAQIARKLFTESLAVSKVRLRWGIAFTLFSSGAYYAVFLAIIKLGVSGALSMGDLTFLIGSALRLHASIGGLVQNGSEVITSSLYLQDLISFFELRPITRAHLTRQGVTPDALKRGVIFENVHFRYPQMDKWIVRGFNLHIRKGELVALVGENGAGKSTLVKLMTRLYDPQRGRILVDGVDIRDYDAVDLRSRFSVVFQEFVKFELSAADNVAVGNIDQRANLAHVMEACRASGIDKTIIEKLPSRYEQQLGAMFKGSMELSRGQWQGLAVARSFMRGGDIVIWDEPASALDVSSEECIFGAYQRWGKTGLVISHRMETIKFADRVAVLKGGVIVELGAIDELARRRGAYYQLFLASRSRTKRSV
jgi:ATP-binding cassette, subfamily B, bacterial